MTNTTVFKDTSCGLHPGHHQTYTLLRDYEKNHTKVHILAPERDRITLQKHYDTC